MGPRSGVSIAAEGLTGMPALLKPTKSDATRNVQTPFSTILRRPAIPGRLPLPQCPPALGIHFCPHEGWRHEQRPGRLIHHPTCFREQPGRGRGQGSRRRKSGDDLTYSNQRNAGIIRRDSGAWKDCLEPSVTRRRVGLRAARRKSRRWKQQDVPLPRNHAADARADLSNHQS